MAAEEAMRSMERGIIRHRRRPASPDVTVSPLRPGSRTWGRPRANCRVASVSWPPWPNKAP